MNLPLHYGFLGALEAGLIAFIIGLMIYAVMQFVCRSAGGSIAHAIGAACLLSIVAGAGMDIWNLFYLGMTRLESPLYARIALQSIHDPDSLGIRVIGEIIGTLMGVLMGWQWFSRGWREADVDTTTKKHTD